MNLTQYPKVQAEFEKWYENRLNLRTMPSLRFFYEMPFDFQQGVYDAYFRSVGIMATASLAFNSDKYVAIARPMDLNQRYFQKEIKVFDDYNEAKKEALTEACRIREDELNQKI